MASSVVSLSLTTPLKANSFRKYNLTPLPSLRRISCCSTREISLKSRYRVALPATCKKRRSVELFTRCGVSSNDFPAEKEKERSFGEWVEFLGEAVSTAFPVWVSLGCLLGLVKPSAFNWVTPDLTIIGLTVTMLGMGMTLTLDDLRGALKMPKELFAGFVLQYSVGHAIISVEILKEPVLVSDNSFVSGNVALSVLMTAASTLSAVIMTPLLTAKLAKQYVAVDALGLVKSTLQVVLLPVLAGAFMNQYFQRVVKYVTPLMAPIAVGTVAILCGTAIGQNASAILASGKQVVMASVLLHASGFLFGYLFSRLLRIDVASSRTVSIEVGMQNSVLGLVLAAEHFGNPLTAVPCAVSSVCHSIIGSVLAGVWRRSSPKQLED
ncbi:hypothetical protein DY000_02064242 [Brassica cretica]|uniref:Sodium/metabolite cotransporter BASS1, chloroplastic n=1 Tax=Brassica cretica TaxID=69181 RepID=A0ABQ7B405_BRACR|nr:hypothetical protein DY000_02064242 [Brassica cretica]